MKNIIKEEFRRFGSDVTALIIDPTEFSIQLCSGDTEQRQTVKEIRHNWFESNGYNKVAAINASFFSFVDKPTPVQLSYKDAYAVYSNPERSDFPECIVYYNGDMVIKNMDRKEFDKDFRKGASFGFSMSNKLIEDGSINPVWWEDVPSNLKGKHPRSLFGKTKDDKFIMITVDGRGNGNLGATLHESAIIMQELNVEIGGNMDGGGSTSMTLDNKVINTPSSGNLRNIANALVVYCKGISNIDDGGVEHNFYNEKFYTTPQSLNVREIPTTKGNKPLRTLDKGTEVTGYLRAPNGWKLINNSKTNEEWVSDYYLTDSAPNPGCSCNSYTAPDMCNCVNRTSSNDNEMTLSEYLISVKGKRLNSDIKDTILRLSKK